MTLVRIIKEKDGNWLSNQSYSVYMRPFMSRFMGLKKKIQQVSVVINDVNLWIKIVIKINVTKTITFVSFK